MIFPIEKVLNAPQVVITLKKFILIYFKYYFTSEGFYESIVDLYQVRPKLWVALFLAPSSG